MNRNIKSINPFVVFCQKVIPLAFDESMSYYECLCALKSFIENQLITAINNNIELLEIWYWDYDNIEKILNEKLNNNMLKIILKQQIFKNTLIINSMKW